MTRLQQKKGRTLDGKGLEFTASIKELGEAGVLFWGTPGQVYQQIESFYHRVGGFGHMMMEAQAVHLDYDETVSSLSLFFPEGTAAASGPSGAGYAGETGGLIRPGHSPRGLRSCGLWGFDLAREARSLPAESLQERTLCANSRTRQYYTERTQAPH